MFIVWDSIKALLFKFLFWILPSILLTTFKSKSSLVKALDLSCDILGLIWHLMFTFSFPTSLLVTSSGTTNLTRLASDWGNTAIGTRIGIGIGMSCKTFGLKCLTRGKLDAGAATVALETLCTAIGSPLETTKTLSALGFSMTFSLLRVNEDCRSVEPCSNFCFWISRKERKPLCPSHLNPGLRLRSDVFSIKFKACKTLAISYSLRIYDLLYIG